MLKFLLQLLGCIVLEGVTGIPFFKLYIVIFLIKTLFKGGSNN